jgi:CheY-like chemotaxis protein
MRNVLFLDDSENRIEQAIKIFTRIEYDITVVRTAEETIKELFGKSWDVVSLDHDLGGQVYVNSNREDCGMEVVRWIKNNHPDVKKFIIHSWNIPAAREMMFTLRDCGYQANCYPFGT